MDLIVQIVVASGGWAAALVTYHATRSKWVRENIGLQAEVAGLAPRVADLEAQLETARNDLRHQLKQARLSVEIEHLLAEEIGSLGGGAATTALTRARRNAEAALGDRVKRDSRVTTRAAIDGWLSRFEVDPTGRQAHGNGAATSTAA